MALRVVLALGAVSTRLAVAMASMTVAAGCRDNVRYGATTGATDADAARPTIAPRTSPPGDARDGAILEPALPAPSARNPASQTPDSSRGAGTSPSADASPDERPDGASRSAARNARPDGGRGDAAREQELPTPEPMGGAWVSCYGNFRPTSTPERDVTRLGLLCGPVNGMRMVGTTNVGEAPEAQDAPNEHTFAARAGECFRVFAVASASVAELGIEVRDAKGWPLASDHSSDRYPIVNPDGPFCVLDAGTYRLRVHARKGSGRYAYQLWRLP